MNFHSKDNDLIKRKALPAQNTTVYSDPIDLGMKGAGPINSVFLVEVPATPALANGQTYTFTPQDCDTLGGTYADIVGYGNIVLTGAGGAGAPKSDFPPLKLHGHVRRFNRWKIAASATAGDNTGVIAEFSVAQG